MSVQLKAAMRSFARQGKTQLIPIQKSKQDGPFEKYQHFVVAPELRSSNQPTPRATRTIPQKLGPLEEPHVNNRDRPNTPQNDFAHTQLLAFDHKLDKFLIASNETSVWEAGEQMFMDVFNANKAIWFTDIPSIGVLYSPSNEIYTNYDQGLISHVYRTKSIILTPEPTSHPAFDAEFDGNIVTEDMPTLIFPLLNFQKKVVAIGFISRHEPFEVEDEHFIAFFQHKFEIFSKWLLNQPVQEPLVLDILHLHRVEQLIPTLASRLQNFFMCRSCEVWSLDRSKKKVMRYTEHSTTEIVAGGVIADVLETETSLNTVSVKAMAAYNAEVDGDVDEALIAIPVTEPSNRYVYATVLRGPQSRPIFNGDDEDIVKKLAPFIALALANADAFTTIQTEFEKSMQEREGLAALLEVAEILSGQLDTERLCEIIMEKGRYLTKADRCSLFLVSQNRESLITSLHKGLKNCINIPLGKGVVGKTVMEAKALNIKDAYEDPAFDPATDLSTGYRTRSILSVPIFNQRGEVMGVTEMINKEDGKPFTKWDTNLIQIFNVFCGISLENARLYKESLDMSSQLRSFFGISLSLSKTEDTKRVMTDIVRNARRALDARRATVFLVDEPSSLLLTYVVDGGRMPISLPLGKGVVGHCAMTCEGVISNDAYADPRFNKAVDQATGFKTVSLCAAPIIDAQGNMLGVIEMVNKIHGGFRERDLKLLNSIATFASVTLENSRLKGIATLGSLEVELSKYMSEVERKLHDVPAKLVLQSTEQNTASSLDFFAVDWHGDGLIRVLFYLANKFKILETWKVPNETFFRFIHEIRKTYNDVPYHNWIHACDVTEYVSYEISTAKLDQVFNSLEMFSIFTAAICHDANHDGFNNIYNLKAETPLGILFKDQSVMETHHCTVAIDVLSRDECNIMANLESHENKQMWTMIIRLILATDMAHHFKLVKQANELLDSNSLSMDNEEHRILCLQLILKTADISNVSRPFQIAERWCDILCEEFFRQGDNEKRHGIELTSPLNDREHSDKPKSQIGFYNFVCIPLYQVVARIYPVLEVNLNSVKSNLEVWKSMVEAPK